MESLRRLRSSLRPIDAAHGTLLRVCSVLRWPLLLTLLLRAAPVLAQPAAEQAPAPSAAPAKENKPAPARLALSGYVEANYTYNLGAPTNGINHFRGFDNRHDTFTLSNVVLDGTFDWESLSGKIALQVGHTPNTYYLGEPTLAGAPGTAGSDASTWKYLQQAWAGWKAPLGRGLLLQLGLHLSPIGIEGIAVKDNWNWSRSNLFFGLPFYHTGLRAKYEITDRLAVIAYVVNGWNSVTDNNRWKSLLVQGTYTIPDRLSLSLLYSGGVERPSGAPEGQPWRHLFDAWMQVDAAKWLSFAAQGNAGFEDNHFGRSSWYAFAAYVRGKPHEKLYLVGRFDRFGERVAKSGEGTASSIFWPVPWMSSLTATVDARPHPNVSVRAEYRHDMAGGNAFFKGTVTGDGSAASSFVPNASTQDTVTLGVTSWF